MSDLYRPRDDWPRRSGQPDEDRTRNAAQASGAPEQRTSDAWADVYGWQHPPKRVGPHESLRGVAWVASALISLTAVLEMLSALDFFTRAPQVFSEGRFYYGIEVGYFYTSGDPPSRAVIVVLFMAAAALFITWQYKHARNAERLGQRGGLGPGWAIGGWFIPFANLVLPVVQLVQSSSASDPPPDRYFRSTSRAGLVVLWAVVFYVSLFELSVVTPNPDTVETTDTINGLLSLLSIPAGLLAVVMIWQLTKRQETALNAQRS